MGCDAPGIVELRERRIGQEDEPGAAKRAADIRGDGCNFDAPLAVRVFQRQRARRGERLGIATPQAHFVAALGEVGGGGIGAVAAADDGDLHPLMPTQALCEMSKMTPFGSRNLRSKSTPPPPFSSRWKRPPFLRMRSLKPSRSSTTKPMWCRPMKSLPRSSPAASSLWNLRSVRLMTPSESDRPSP